MLPESLSLTDVSLAQNRNNRRHAITRAVKCYKNVMTATKKKLVRSSAGFVDTKLIEVTVKLYVILIGSILFIISVCRFFSIINSFYIYI